jgi:AraC-like DNA-binding protein
MTVIRGTSLSHFPELVTRLGGDPQELLARAGIPEAAVGQHDAFITYSSMIRVVEQAAAATGAADFGRQLGQAQGIEILGPVGVAARTANSVSAAFDIFEAYLAAYSPAIGVRVRPLADPAKHRFEFEILLDDPPACPQTIEVSLGVALRVFRFLIGSSWAPVRAHLPHEALTPTESYMRYFGSRASFAQPFAGFTLLTRDLKRPLTPDIITHSAVIAYLDTLDTTTRIRSLSHTVREFLGQLLPTGTVSLDFTASQFRMHPKTLQRRLALEGYTYGRLIDELRRDTALHYLRDTDLSMSHLARELGYAEKSELTRSAHRWFGRPPLAQRRALRQAMVSIA